MHEIFNKIINGELDKNNIETYLNAYNRILLELTNNRGNNFKSFEDAQKVLDCLPTLYLNWKNYTVFINPFDFLQGLLHVGFKQFDSINSKFYNIETSAGRKRSLVDIYRHMKHEYPNITLKEVSMMILESPYITFYYCSTKLRKVHMSVGYFNSKIGIRIKNNTVCYNWVDDQVIKTYKSIYNHKLYLSNSNYYNIRDEFGFNSLYTNVIDSPNYNLTNEQLIDKYSVKNNTMLGKL